MTEPISVPRLVGLYVAGLLIVGAISLLIVWLFTGNAIDLLGMVGCTAGGIGLAWVATRPVEGEGCCGGGRCVRCHEIVPPGG